MYGEKVTFNATVTPVLSVSGTPTGTVMFLDGTTVLDTAHLSGGMASYTTSAFALGVGSNSITVSYSGNSSLAASTSAVLAQTVNQDPTSTKVATSSSSVVYGKSVTFTATVTANSPGSGTPTGTVTFYDGTNVLGMGTLNSSGKATFTTSALATGTHSITAEYGGNTNYTTSTSSALTQTVNQDPTTTGVSASQTSVPPGTRVTFTAAVEAKAPGSGIPTGTVTFYDGSTVLGTMALDNMGDATFTETLLMPGKHKIKVVYSGDTNFDSSTSSVLTVTVT